MTTPTPQRPAGPKVAVVGGGIIGLSIAWRLAASGAQVRLFERGELASEASYVAAGMLAPVSESDPAEAGLLMVGLQSLEQWPQFAAELEQAAGLEPGSLLGASDGTLLVARDADEGRWLEREAKLRRRQNLDCELLTASEARLVEPDLAPSLRGALSVPGDLSVDPRAVCEALIVAARAAGAVLQEHTEITGLDDERLAPADRVIVCAGAWPVGEGVRGPTAVHPVKGQLLVLRDVEDHLREEPIITHVLRGQTVYLVPRGDGRYIVGATMEHRGYDRAVTAWAVHLLLRELFEVLPAAREFAIEEILSGLRPATTSGDPLIGPHPDDPAGTNARILYAIGHYRNGVLLTPITAQRIAEMVVG